MPLGTLDRTAPPLFNQGQSALSKLIFFGALSLFLMVADARFHIVQPIRATLGAVLYPVQWVALKPVQIVMGGGRYLEDLQTAQRNEADARKALMMQAQRASQADTLAQDNARLRELLELRQTTTTPGRAAEVLYDAADPYTRKIVIDQGLAQGVAAGSPVIDTHGVLGQVTQVLPFTSEVTLVIDRDLAIPCRTPARACAAWPSATPRRTAGAWSCASWPPTPTCRRAICFPPAASTVSTRPACRSRRSSASNAAPTRPSPASTVSRSPA